MFQVTVSLRPLAASSLTIRSQGNKSHFSQHIYQSMTNMIWMDFYHLCNVNVNVVINDGSFDPINALHETKRDDFFVGTLFRYDVVEINFLIKLRKKLPCVTESLRTFRSAQEREGRAHAEVSITPTF